MKSLQEDTSKELKAKSKQINLGLVVSLTLVIFLLVRMTFRSYKQMYIDGLDFAAVFISLAAVYAFKFGKK